MPARRTPGRPSSISERSEKENSNNNNNNNNNNNEKREEEEDEGRRSNETRTCYGHDSGGCQYIRPSY